jgi:hypothetical protein
MMTYRSCVAGTTESIIVEQSRPVGELRERPQPSMQIMAQYSPMHDEAALLGMLRSLQGSTGTGIWCYNLRTPTEFTTEVRRETIE